MTPRTATAIAALFGLVAVAPASADFYDGLLAYESRDYGTALGELKPLAEAGDARAQRYLGLLYRDGRGVPQDYVRAHLWLNLAAAAGQAEAAAERDALVRLMDTSQVAEAQRLASAWSPPSAAAPTAAPIASTASAPPAPAVDANRLGRAETLDLQWNLAVHGYDPGPADGILGPRTRAAIRAYQRDAGLPIDGRSTQALLEHLRFSDPPVRSARLAEPDIDPNDPQGDLTRIYTVAVQEELAAQGYRPGPADGIANRRTRDAIRRYQAANGLAVDGRVTLALVNHLRLITGRANVYPVVTY